MTLAASARKQNQCNIYGRGNENHKYGVRENLSKPEFFVEVVMTRQDVDRAREDEVDLKEEEDCSFESSAHECI